MTKTLNKQRRQLLRTGAAMGAGASLGLFAGTESWFGSTAMAASKHSFGEGELQIFSDGHLQLPADFILPDSIDEQERTAFLAAHELQQEQFTPDCNVTLWRSGDKLVLFDVGAGANFMSSAGELLEALAEADVDPAEITDVVFTHGHPDHLWGLLDDFDEFAFPEAAFHMNAIEWDFWRADDTLGKMPEERKTFVVGAQSRLAHLEDRIQLFQYGDEVLSGIEAVDSRGHTPGHTSFALHSGNQSVVVLGDAISHPVISFLKPNWPSGSDQDRELGIKTREALLDRFVHEQSQILGYHLPYPGLGRVERKDGAYQFVADAG